MKSPSSNAKSNLTSISIEGCSSGGDSSDLIPLSASKESEVYGFFQMCGTKAHFTDATTMTTSEVTLPKVQLADSGSRVMDQKSILHQTRLATLWTNGSQTLSLVTHQASKVTTKGEGEEEKSDVVMSDVRQFSYP